MFVKKQIEKKVVKRCKKAGAKRRVYVLQILTANILGRVGVQN